MNAASVFPDPVGAWMRAFAPDAITGHPCAWAGVGASKARSNHALVASEKTSSALMHAIYRGSVGSQRAGNGCAMELYQAEWCPHSHKVRQRLTELGLDFVARQVAAEPEDRDG